MRAPAGNPPAMQPTTKAHWQIHFCVLLWGFTAILGKLITLPALPLVWWRMLLVAATLLLLPRVWRGLRALPPRLLLPLRERWRWRWPAADCHRRRRPASARRRRPGGRAGVGWGCACPIIAQRARRCKHRARRFCYKPLLHSRKSGSSS